LFLALGAAATQGATVSGSAQITGGPNSLNLQYSDTTSPVQISQFTSIFGPGVNGTVLGQVIVGGADDGTFSVYEFGQGTHANESRFQFSELISNTASFDQQFQMNFLINAGALQTSVYEVVPVAGEYLDAGFEITVRFGGAVLFSSSALLHQVGLSTSTTQATLTQGGTSLGGVLEQYQPFAPDSWQYTWNAYASTLDLGVLAPGASATLEYDIRAFGNGLTTSCGSGCGSTRASIGDPLNLSAVGGPDTISAAPVPEPEAPALMLLGLGALALTARRRREVRPRAHSGHA
jgi:hypothetical protein